MLRLHGVDRARRGALLALQRGKRVVLRLEPRAERGGLVGDRAVEHRAVVVREQQRGAVRRQPAGHRVAARMVKRGVQSAGENQRRPDHAWCRTHGGRRQTSGLVIFFMDDLRV